MIQLSVAAAREISRLKSKQQQTNVKFRLAVKPGGCSGWYYEMSFDDATHLGDRVFECHGIQVAIDPESVEYVNGMTVDYSEDLMGGGFRFHNPQADSTCGCGNSFSRT
ncbi:MAG: iron-sulfur cluster assembly accessory protein [Scytonema sp. PMC 1069.18]|nr:iron-sulfur cluster assembly accessory protein [Scytonema sp. PMC 1069.18]MEC4880404.1 iron-sulfur cluster assembly accessory protein [Scytonema sp. PMC 1070.18]